MPELGPAMTIVVLVLIVGVLIWILPGLGRWQLRKDRRHIMGAGSASLATITDIRPRSKGKSWLVQFSFQLEGGERTVYGAHKTTQSAIDSLGLSIGSTVRVHYLPKWPGWAFIDALTLAERIPAGIPSSSTTDPDRDAAQLFYVSYVVPNSYKWFGSGDLAFVGQTLRVTAKRRRPFWFAATEQIDFELDGILNVEKMADLVRFEIAAPATRFGRVTLQAVNSAEAEKIAARLPSKKTEKFVPEFAEQAAFASALLLVTPRARITPTLVAINLLMFAITAAFGGGLMNPNGEVMIRFGTDYTPLTLGGQWWRLLTSTFLHFGLLHVALNMWALYVNGLVAERIYGSARFLFIYLVAGVAGSVASLLWHPVVNGAGASGAIFGVIGALLAFFVRRERGVPASVLKAQLTSTSIFVVYSLAIAARSAGIDNAAHIGGLIGGFVMGLLLARPLEAERESKSWAIQWVMALGVSGAAALAIGYLLVSGGLTPRLAHDGNGNPIPLDGLLPAIRSFGGVELGMTSNDVVLAKGEPLIREEASWLYNALDARHDGVVAVIFRRGEQNGIGTVVAIEFMGHDQESAPIELPRLNSLKTSEAIAKYGAPVSREERGEAEMLWFRNGIFVGAEHDQVMRYGVYDTSALRNQVR